MILNLLIGLIASSAIQTAFARTWFLSEIDLRKRAQVISKIRFERTKLLIGIDPESCKKEESADRKEQLVMKQLEEVRKRGHLSHCSHLKFPGQEALESSLAQTPMPGRIRMPETDVPKPKPTPVVILPPQVPGEPERGGVPIQPTTPSLSSMPSSQGSSSKCDQKGEAEHAARTGRMTGKCAGHYAWPYMGFGSRQEQDEYIALAQTGEDLRLTYLHRAVGVGENVPLNRLNSIDDNFRYRTLTHFNGDELKSEGMHALRIFYSGENPLSSAYENPLECRVIISGDVEYTGALLATPTHPCLRLCQKKLKELVEEKKPKGFFMSCHLLGETIGTDTRGEASSQGTQPKESQKMNCKVQEGVQTRSWVQSTNSYRIDQLQTVLEKEVSFKTECYREFVDYYYERSQKIPLIGEKKPTDPDMLVLHLGQGEKMEKIGEFKLRAPLAEEIPKTDACVFDTKVLYPNFIFSESYFSANFIINHYLTWTAKELAGKDCKTSCDQVIREKGPRNNNFLPKDFFVDWSFTCSDKNGIYKKCTMKGGCK